MSTNVWPPAYICIILPPVLECDAVDCMQASSRSEQDGQVNAAGSGPTETNERRQHKLHIEDWVPQEGISMPKETKGTLIEKLNAALQLLQVISDRVSLQSGLC